MKFVQVIIKGQLLGNSIAPQRDEMPFFEREDALEEVEISGVKFLTCKMATSYDFVGKKRVIKYNTFIVELIK